MDYIVYEKNLEESKLITETIQKLTADMMFMDHKDLKKIRKLLEKSTKDLETNSDRIQKNVLQTYLQKNPDSIYLNNFPKYGKTKEDDGKYNFIPIGVWLEGSNNERPFFIYRNVIYFDEETQKICKLGTYSDHSTAGPEVKDIKKCLFDYDALMKNGILVDQTKKKPKASYYKDLKT